MMGNTIIILIVIDFPQPFRVLPPPLPLPKARSGSPTEVRKSYATRSIGKKEKRRCNPTTAQHGGSRG